MNQYEIITRKMDNDRSGGKGFWRCRRFIAGGHQWQFVKSPATYQIFTDSEFEIHCLGVIEAVTESRPNSIESGTLTQLQRRYRSVQVTPA